MTTVRNLYVNSILVPYIDLNRDQADRSIGNGLEATKVLAIADTLLNLPDYLKRENPPHPELVRFKDARAYRESLWEKNPEYEIVCDIANSRKHRFVTRDGRKLEDIGEVRETYALCRYRDNGGEYYRTLKAVIIHTNDGKKQRNTCFNKCRQILGTRALTVVGSSRNPRPSISE